MNTWSLCMAAFVLIAGLGHPAHATLLARDLNNDSVTDAYYDTVLDVTWLRDANLISNNNFGLSYGVDLGDHPADNDGPNSNYIFSSGRATWGGAMHWIDAMNVASYLGYSNWRLPKIVDTGIVGCDYGYGGTDCGFNVETIEAITNPPTIYSELAYMYYVNLDNKGTIDINGAIQSGSGLVNDPDNPNDESLFLNVQQGSAYWSGSEYLPYIYAAWYFHMVDGYQSAYGKSSNLFVWALRDGDAATIPEPESLGLVGLGLVGLAWFRMQPRQSRK